ncbi:uncharacterized protein EI97DRAFT_5285 [Westerdykella ornata]|uniref:Ubiquitin-like-conjugating enzyme ATG10 n=1 Tax=Westerdykella ornata TaxID=318751 RepID=A0A6A6JVP6_WESOR|nr:uncharacterized protein EI97DRAFT_5285 [Westerdykella ornata]KAF2280672.1 hypothetical protein EI97DRAFT_5285 [Westerdykella ornata]
MGCIEANSNTVAQFPHISSNEFASGCEQLVELFLTAPANNQSDWLSAEVIPQDGSVGLRIQKEIFISDSAAGSPDSSSDDQVDDIPEEEEDEGELRPTHCSSFVQYDILFSPTYSLPTLYFTLVSPNPTLCIPSLEVLYTHLIPPSSRSQTLAVGVMGGVTITDHPVTNKPVYFIHPCQTAAVLKASVKRGMRVSPVDYLVLWVGAMGACVGLHMPLGLAGQEPLGTRPLQAGYEEAT